MDRFDSFDLPQIDEEEETRIYEALMDLHTDLYYDRKAEEQDDNTSHDKTSRCDR